MQRDLIVFAEDFETHPSSTQHIVKKLACDRKIIWINSIGLRQPKFNLNDLKRTFKKLIIRKSTFFEKQLNVEKNKITIVNLITIPAPNSDIARKIAKKMMLYQLRSILHCAQLKKPILWCSLPTAADLCGYLGESAVIYYCGDDFEFLSGVDHQSIAKHEKKLVKKANLIFTASNMLLHKFPLWKTRLLPHGVDVKLFSTPAPRATDLPQNGKPIAGFYGSLSNWIDYKMLNEVAREKQDWNFVFIGPQKLRYSKLPTYDNVYYLGTKTHQQLPQYSQHWDVSLLPFKTNKQILTCSPLKLMEYLAVESTIISTHFPALEPFRNYINIVRNSKEMSQALSNFHKQKKSSRNVVEKDTWEKRSAFVNQILEQI
ncbi:putative glycosyltransferase [Candidatus Photodesmus blepharus]|uniref:Putative glycosyltransferase n=1 Tax=Candidatus Photodesmus blepharonis TaxID=1179155 RepID=A0A084CPL5_9GAMM|nr:glycosyl transferase [Candidatus Photodesmus blepharus]KEY91744.1 putative glycosyltransferase [Candidatus Photodesmus blepharus]